MHPNLNRKHWENETPITTKAIYILTIDQTIRAYETLKMARTAAIASGSHYDIETNNIYRTCGSGCLEKVGNIKEVQMQTK